MHLDPIITHIQAECPSIAQVVKAENAGQSTVNTLDVVFNLVESSVSGRAYASRLPDKKVFPALVYNLVSSSKVSYSQFNILQSDVFIVYFQAKTHPEILTIRESIKTSISGSSNDIEITDETISYLYDQDLHQCALELTIVSLCGASQSIPAVYVYESSTTAAPNDQGALRVAQLKDAEIDFTIIAKHSDLEIVRNELESAIVGYKENLFRAKTEFVSSTRLDSLPNTSIFSDRYKVKLNPIIANRA